MKKFMYSVFDKQAKLFSLPFNEVNDSAAIRSFKLAISHDGTLLHDCPQDYDLYRVGSFDDENGEFTNDVSRLYNGFSEVKSDEET